MERRKFLRIIATVMACTATTFAFAQTARIFKGAWYSPEMYVNIDFHMKNIPDPNSMDGDPCAGTIKMNPKYSSSTYTLENVKVSGNKATASAYLAEGNAAMTFERQADGSIKMTCANFTYVPEEGGTKKLPQTIVLRKAAPFAGTWKLKGGDGSLDLTLYDKSILGEDNEGNQALCHGTIYIAYNRGMYVDNCMVTECEANGNQAEISFIGGRDGCKYRATLAYNPTTKQITVTKVAPLTAGDEGECYVEDGLVFNFKSSR